MPILEVHKMSVAEVKAELEAEGFALERVIDVAALATHHRAAHVK